MYKKVSRPDCRAPGCIYQSVKGDVFCLAHGGEYKKCLKCNSQAVVKGLCGKHREKKRRRCFATGCTTVTWRGIYCYAHRDIHRCKQFTCIETALEDSEYCKEHNKGPKPKITVCTAPRGGYVLKERKVGQCKFHTCTKFVRIAGFCHKHAVELGYICEKPSCSRKKVENSDFCSIHCDVDRRIID